MKAAIKKPGLDWEHVDIEPTLKNLQEIVGGYIELVPHKHTNATMYCNEDGLSLGLELNIEVYPDGSSDDLIVGIVGPVVMLGPIMNDKVTDLTESMFLRTIEAIDWLQKDYKTNLL